MFNNRGVLEVPYTRNTFFTFFANSIEFRFIHFENVRKKIIFKGSSSSFSSSPSDDFSLLCARKAGRIHAWRTLFININNVENMNSIEKFDGTGEALSFLRHMDRQFESNRQLFKRKKKKEKVRERNGKRAAVYRCVARRTRT